MSVPHGAAQQRGRQAVLESKQAPHDLILRSRASRGVSKDEGPTGATWFETALARLLSISPPLS
jgi:hypothetical protein